MSEKILSILGFCGVAALIFFRGATAHASEPAATPMLSKIECTGKAREAETDKSAKITLTVESGSASYPAQVSARLQLGGDSPETLLSTLTTSQSQDESGRLIHVFHSSLDLHRSFEAMTTDLKSGIGSLRLDGPMRAPSLQCVFWLAGEATGSGTPSTSPKTKR